MTGEPKLKRSDSRRSRRDKPRYNAVIAIDGTAQSEKAFNWYLERCYLPGHRLILVQGIQSPTFFGFSDSIVFDAVIEDLRDQSLVLQEKYANILKERQISGKYIASIEESPHDWVARVAKHYRANVVVMGSQGCDKLHKSVLSTTSDCIMEQAGDAFAIYPGKGVVFSESVQVKAPRVSV